MNRLAQLDHQYVWHPFTQMQDWLRTEPIVLVEGKGAVLRDVKGREYLDANASIWTNLHGHRNPRIDAAIRRQLDRVAHTSATGPGRPCCFPPSRYPRPGVTGVRSIEPDPSAPMPGRTGVVSGNACRVSRRCSIARVRRVGRSRA